MHTIDYNTDNGQFELMFVHGTSSPNITSILRHGIVRPDFDRALDVVLAAAPHLAAQREFFRARLGRLPFGVEDRQSHDKVVFAARLATRASIELFDDEGRLISEHGGEIYAVIWRKLSQIARDEALGDIPKRFPGAEPYAILFRVPLGPHLTIAYPRTTADFAKTLACTSFTDLVRVYEVIEVRFIDPLPSGMIYWQGSCPNALHQIENEVISPIAREMLRKELDDRDAWSDIEDFLGK